MYYFKRLQLNTKQNNSELKEQLTFVTSMCKINISLLAGHRW
jgi:hypothetical protein